MSGRGTLSTRVTAGPCACSTPRVLCRSLRPFAHTQPYRYFGRARELPGVKELFATAAKDQAEVESYKTVKVSMFDNAPPEYYGNTAEEGEQGRRLLEAERKAEQAGQ